VTDETSGTAEPMTDGDGTSGSAGGEAPRPAQKRRLRLLLTVAAVVLVLDIVTKVLAVRLLTPGQPVSIVGDTITWTLVRNSGAAFSMATGYTWVLTLVATGG
jgi:signal peptidase II